MDLSTREGRKKQGSRIQEAATGAGLSLEALAREIGCSRALLYQYVSGTTLAQPDKVQRIAAATGTAFSSFYETEGEPAIPASGDESRPRPATSSAAADAASAAEATPPPVQPAKLDEQRLRTSLAALQELAAAYRGGPSPAEHLTVCQRVIPLARELADRQAEAEALFAIGNAHLQLGDHAAAEGPLRQALSVFEGLGNADRALACRQSLGGALTAGGSLEAAEEQFRQVAASANWDNRWKGILSLGALDEWRGDYRAAIARLDEVEEVLESGDDAAAVRIARTYLQANRVNVFLGCGDYRNALGLARAACAEAETSGNADQYLEALLNVGVCRSALGEWVESVDLLHRAEKLSRLLGDAQREVAAQSCLAEGLADAGRHAEAKALAREAVTAASANGAARLLILAHRALGTACLRARATDDAEYHLRQALDRSAAVGMAGGEAWCQVRLAEAKLWGGALDDARALATQAAEIAGRLGAEHAEAEATLVEAACALRAGDQAAATAKADAALARARALMLPDLLVRALHGAAAAALAGGDDTTAEEHWRAAVAEIARLRTAFVETDEPDSLLEDPRRSAVFAEYAAFLRARQREDEVARLLDSAAWPPLAELIG